ncbi:hypothetical protein I550_3247 [Mycobacterium intracellulare 1956]|uniref:Uncharacterized protein n=1 Tax=Mycobacterium intracellulare 1956 TaxID=1299331 RepID=X8CGZ5_MYCIT|nr:hypothetical protein I548_1047 [Mycobacterium intracellulare]EUA55096.1 hypothetical protein I550_3247 [Mycobacterium intracellulare 1956]
MKFWRDDLDIVEAVNAFALVRQARPTASFTRPAPNGCPVPTGE